MKIQSFKDQSVPAPRRVVIAGGTGLIGSACREVLLQEGYEVVILTRRSGAGQGYVQWDPDQKWIAENVIDGASAVINVCGLPLPDRRWTKSYKNKLIQSRVRPAEFIRELVEAAVNPPGCYIGSSAIGIYGDQGDMKISETTSTTASGFVPDLVRRWESAHRSVRIGRTVIFRIGIVLTGRGGFLARVVPPTRMGVYPCFGNGRQLMSWIHLEDLVRMILFALHNLETEGVFNATTPGAIGQCSFMKVLKEIQGSPGLLFPVPTGILKLIFGEMATLLFESSDVRPDLMQAAGFQFKYTDIRTALAEEIT